MDKLNGSVIRIGVVVGMILLAAVAAAGQEQGIGITDPGGCARPLWMPGEEFLQNWLVCGVFPAEPTGPKGLFAELDDDFLTEHGGESAIVPVEGMTHALPAGGTVAWKVYRSREDIVRGSRVVGDTPGVVYAYTSIDSPAAGPALLAVGVRQGAKVWFNGQPVLLERSLSGLRIDAHLVPVELHAGVNHLLLKSQQARGIYDFCARVLSEGAALELIQHRVEPAILEAPGQDGDGELAVRSDLAFWDSQPDPPAAQVEIVTPGGGVVASAETLRGGLVRFDPGSWADGPYEIRVRTTDYAGQPVVAHERWQKGDFRPAAAALVVAAARADASKPEGMVAQLLSRVVIDRLGGPPEQARPEQWPLVHEALMEFAELQQAEAGLPGGTRPYGFVRLAYRDEVDGSPQFCRVILPPEYTPDRPWPMMVYLHGRTGTNPPYYKKSILGRHDSRVDRFGVILIRPFGRGNASYEGIGERDVLRCIAMAKEAFNVDEDRVYIFGESMGGGGTWYLASRYPELFAAIGPVYGGWDYRQWTTPEAYGKMSQRERFDKERWSSFVQLESLLHVPMFLNAGSHDRHRWGIRLATTWLQRWGYPVQYHEHPTRGHYDLGYRDDLFAWFLTHRRVRNPREVRIRAAELRSAAAYWVCVEQQDDQRAMIQARARIVGPNLVELSTQNVLAITLDPAGPLVDSTLPMTVLWNGREIRRPISNGSIVLRAEGYQPGPLVKTPACAGPFGQVTATPHAIVVGTISPDTATRKLCRLMAEKRTAEWERWQHVQPRVIDDVELTDADAKRYSLVLIGGPADNAVTARLGDALGLTIDGESVGIDGVSFPAPDAAVTMVRPHPVRPDRYLAVVAGTSPQGLFTALEDWPGDVDFCISDGRIPLPGSEASARQVRIASGLFDRDWRINEASTDRGDEALRAQCPVNMMPPHLDMPEDQPVVYLADVLEQEAGGDISLLIRNRNTRGEPLMLGGVTYERGLAIGQEYRGTGYVSYQLPTGVYSRLRAVVGADVGDPSAMTAEDKRNVMFVMAIEGDGRELFRSEPFLWDSPPVEIDLDIAGVKTLRLSVVNRSREVYKKLSINWADLRIER